MAHARTLRCVYPVATGFFLLLHVENACISGRLRAWSVSSSQHIDKQRAETRNFRNLGEFYVELGTST